MLIAVVPPEAAYVVERLGKYHRTLGPGTHFLVPFIDAVRFRHRMDEQQLDLEMNAITHDNVPVKVSAILRWKIVEVERASYAVADVATAMRLWTETGIRGEIGKAALTDVLPDRDALDRRVMKVLEDSRVQWGVEVVACDIRSIEPPADVVAQLEREAARARAERQNS